MMKCRRCHADAAVSLPSHNTAFCPSCFLEFFSKQVASGIHEQKLLVQDDRILAALSGGKDSLALILELKRQGYDVTGLHIDLGIPGYSDVSRGVVERFCSLHHLPLIIRRTADEGLAIPDVKKTVDRPICSVCGKIKRYIFNRTAAEEGFTALATGHNLDDEVARLTSNILRWDTDFLSDEGPLLGAGEGFIKKVKPLWRLTEFETANYAFLMGIENYYAPCPYSHGASFSVYKGLWMELEEKMPGRKLHFYQRFLTHARSFFQKGGEDGKLKPCESCGSPTTAGLCSVCRIKALMQGGKQDAGAGGQA